jgi:CRP-like cAMP-binding protein
MRSGIMKYRLDLSSATTIQTNISRRINAMTETISLSSFVRAGSLLADLPDGCLQRLSQLGTQKSYTKGKTVFQKGDVGNFLAVILSGNLKVSAFSVSGTETVMNLLQKGDVVGEIAAIDGGERTADVIAIEECELLVIHRADILRQMETDSELSIGISKALCAKLRDASNTIESTTLDISRRVAAALIRLAEKNTNDDDDNDVVFRLQIDQTTLAQYAGLTRSNLNRVLKRFERAGASCHQKGILEIYDLEWLEEFSLSEE